MSVTANAGLLRRFFDDCPGTRLHLHFEAITGPWERLFDGDADLILHHIDKADPRLEFLNLFSVRVMPVVAPGFLRFPISHSITPEQMRDYAQCVIRDTVRHTPPRDYFVVEGETGERFWLFRSGDGEDPATGNLRWYLHGVFA